MWKFRNFLDQNVSIFDIIMKIEEKINSEVIKSNQISPHFFKSYSGHQTSDLSKENAKVIKLIQQKMYPLNHLQKSSLIFPKLKEKYSNDFKHSLKQTSASIEISLGEQQTRLPVKPKSEIKNQHKSQERLSKKKKNLKYKLSETKKSAEFPISNFQRGQLSNLSYTIHEDRSLDVEKNNNETIFGESWQNSSFFQNEAQRIINESAMHCNFLKKMKSDINKRKETYYNNVSFTDIFDNTTGAQKENYSIEYVVNTIQSKVAKNNPTTTPYERQSPNKLGQYARLFENKKRNLMLWEELELGQPPVLQKEKSFGEDVKMHKSRTKNRKKTVQEQQLNVVLENAFATKYRIKNNHKRLIQLAKSRPN